MYITLLLSRLAHYPHSFEALCPYQHKSIVTVYGICEDAPDGQLLIVMELCVKSVWKLLEESRDRVCDVVTAWQ
jgi:hypothetical protein